MSAITAKQALAIFVEAGRPGRNTVDTQLALVSKKIKIAATLKMRKIRYFVFAHYECPYFTEGDLALVVAKNLKTLGYEIKIRGNELSISW